MEVPDGVGGGLLSTLQIQGPETRVSPLNIASKLKHLEKNAHGSF